jgi:hypothetical protein
MLFRFHRVIAIALALCAVSAFCAVSRADPLLTTGIGLSNCGKLARDLKPGAGFDHLPNALLFYWVQGYMSAANIYILNEDTEYIDLERIEEPKITKLVADFCKANPDKKPVSAIDKLIRDADKIEAKESDAFNPWAN